MVTGKVSLRKRGRERMEKVDLGEPDVSLNDLFFLYLFMGPSGAASCSAARAESSSGGKCRQEEEEKEAYPPAGTSLQGFAHKFNYSCEEKPVGRYLQVLAPQTFSHSGTTSATTSTWYILAGIITPVALYLSVFTCREKAYIAMQKEETWIGQFNMRLGI
jgi:hypothetical protein